MVNFADGRVLGHELQLAAAQLGHVAAENHGALTLDAGATLCQQRNGAHGHAGTGNDQFGAQVAAAGKDQLQGFVRLLTGRKHGAGDVCEVSLFEVAGHAHAVVHGVCVRGRNNYAAGGVKHNNAVNHAGVTLGVISLGEGVGPQAGVHHGEHGVGSIFVDLVANRGVTIGGSDLVAGQQRNGAVVAHDGHEGDIHTRAGANTFTASFVGVGADVLVNPDAVCFVADSVFHITLNDVVVEEGSDVGGAHVREGTESTGFAGAGYGVRGATVGNNVVGGEP